MQPLGRWVTACEEPPQQAPRCASTKQTSLQRSRRSAHGRTLIFFGRLLSSASSASSCSSWACKRRFIAKLSFKRASMAWRDSACSSAARRRWSMACRRCCSCSTCASLALSRCASSLATTCNRSSASFLRASLALSRRAASVAVCSACARACCSVDKCDCSVDICSAEDRSRCAASLSWASPLCKSSRLLFSSMVLCCSACNASARSRWLSFTASSLSSCILPRSDSLAWSC
mmetsp:Transcript_18006/g.56695  ORF Transcript_18006/g.56695 Transcript_18006/m.56695 type:complete len:233 (+) Transcript_18006:521-1219(+)